MKKTLKKSYQKPLLQIVELSSADIICTSDFSRVSPTFNGYEDEEDI